MNVIVLAAGAGVRMRGLDFPKPLLLVDEIPLITHVMRACPLDSTFYVAVNSEATLLKDFLVSQVEFDVVVVDVGMPTDPGAGPGTSLRKCLEIVKSPALFTVADGIYRLPRDIPAGNWLGVPVIPPSRPGDYCYISESKGHISTNEKGYGHEPDQKAWIGVGFIYDWEQALENLVVVEDGERQCSPVWKNGHWSLAPMVWTDVGTREKYEEVLRTRQDYRKPSAFTLTGGARVVKVFPSDGTAKNFVKRGKNMAGMGPNNIFRVGRVVSYDHIPGDNFYKHVTPIRFEILLYDLVENFWNTDFEHGTIDRSEFYKTKTIERARSFLQDEPRLNVDWGMFEDGIKANVHGDLQFDNMIWTPDKVSLIDWRSDFGDDLDGDLYYDLAKLLSGILLNIRVAKTRTFRPIGGAELYIDILFNFHKKYNLDWERTRILSALCFIGMSGVHTEPYASVFYDLGLGYLKEVS